MDEEDVRDTFDQYVKSTYNFDFSLKKEQVKILTSLLNGSNVFAALPTGYGKSMCFVLPPLLRDELDWTVSHTALVISPLTALMGDQVLTSTAQGVRAIAVKEDTSATDVQDVFSGKYSIVFMSPERALSKFWRKAFLSDSFRKSVCLLALDECHCITEWGGDFRPKYKEVCGLRSVIEAPVVCLTATADKVIRNETLKTMCLETGETVVVSVLPDRPNIFLDFKRSKQNVEDDLRWIVDKLVETTTVCPKTIIYCRKTSEVSRVYEYIRDSLHQHGMGIEDETRLVEQFHVSLDEDTRHLIATRFKSRNGDLRVLVSTVAFGLGMQISDVQIIVHWGVPKSIMTYWQEVGRGGRDGRSTLAITYAYGRSMDIRTTTKDMRDLAKRSVSSECCIRKDVLDYFQLTEDDTFVPPAVCSVRTCGNECQCGQCWCCGPCLRKCPCTTEDVDYELRYY